MTPSYEWEFILIRDQIIERDRHACRDCGKTENLHVHHIIKRRDGGSNNLSNLITLCRPCHRKEEFRDYISDVGKDMRKTVMLDEDVYNYIVSQKQGMETISDCIKRLLKK